MAIIYRDWGFRGNPFLSTALPPNAEGAKLLVGREEELKKIHTRLCSPPKIVTVEGRNGIGKTSIINVASYRAYESFLNKEPLPLFVPCDQVFQLEPNHNLDNFVRRVFLGVAQTLLKEADALKEAGYTTATDLTPLKHWLNSPVLKSVQGMLSIFGSGAGASSGESANTSLGFLESGLEDLVRQLLVDIFADGEGGGVVCTIDNLELLKSSDAAREMIEALRDRLLTIRGLRWILCGSTGIVRGLASSARMAGYLHAPVEVGDMRKDLAQEIVSSRVEVFANASDPYLPITSREFGDLFGVLNGNLRDSLSFADDYCLKVYESGKLPQTDADKREAFAQWIKSESTAQLQAASAQVSDRPWELFTRIVDAGGQCSPGDYELFGFNSQQAMRSNVLILEGAQLIQSVRDDDDNRRKTILVTPHGWLVHFARIKGFNTLFAS